MDWNNVQVYICLRQLEDMPELGHDCAGFAIGTWLFTDGQSQVMVCV